MNPHTTRPNVYRQSALRLHPVEPWEREQRAYPAEDRHAQWVMRGIVAMWVVALAGIALLVVVYGVTR